MSKVITNAAPVIGLYTALNIEGLNLLLQLYSEISTSDYVYEEELRFPERLVVFKNDYIKKRTPPKTSLEKLTDEFKGIHLGEITCAALYNSGGYDELLMANKDAEELFIQKGIEVRNVLELSYLAFQKNLFDEEKAKQFIKGMSQEFKPTERVIAKFREGGFGFFLDP